MAIHVLKTWNPYFEALWDKSKTFEVRKDDRGFEVWDTLLLRETVMETGEYTGRLINAQVTYILRDSQLLPDGMVVMAIAERDRGGMYGLTGKAHEVRQRQDEERLARKRAREMTQAQNGREES